MPTWKMKLLGFGLAMGCIGGGAQVATYFLNAPATSVSQTAPPPSGTSTPARSSGFLGNQPPVNSPPISPPPTAPSTTPSGGIVNTLTPFMSHFGFSLFVGILFGVIFRTFLRTALLISALIAAAVYGLTHLLHLNVDLTQVKTDTNQAVSWLTDQGYRLKTMLFHVLPSSTAASVGFLLGFKKR
jgi:uncharacterized membrane protein (Fun14 family)